MMRLGYNDHKAANSPSTVSLVELFLRVFKISAKFQCCISVYYNSFPDPLQGFKIQTICYLHLSFESKTQSIMCYWNVFFLHAQSIKVSRKILSYFHMLDVA